MVLKEIKKVLFNKIIIVLFASLCLINVILGIQPETMTAEEIQQEQDYQKEKIKGYSDFLEKVKNDGEAMQSFSLFSDNNKYQTENSKRAVKAYEKVAGVKPVYGNYKAIEQVTKFGFSDIILFILVVQIALVLINQELSKGMLELLKSCKNGRVRLIASKLISMGILAFITMLVVYAINFVQLVARYGISNLNVPIQSVPGFYESNMPISIIEYLILFFFVKWLMMCIIGIFTVGVCSRTKNETLTYGIIMLVTLISAVLYKTIDWDMRMAAFKVLSPMSLFDTRMITASYFNINIFQTPFQITITSAVVMIVYLIAAIAFAVRSFIKKKGAVHIKLFSRNGNKEKTIKAYGIYAYEQKKIMIINKVVIFLLVFMAIQGYMVSRSQFEGDYLTRVYNNYISQIYGEANEKSQAYIDKEQARFDEIQASYDKATQQYAEGKIDYTVYSNISREYDSNMMIYDVFNEVKDKNNYLQKLKTDRNISGWFTHDKAFDYIFDGYELYDKNTSFLIMFIVMVLCIVPVFTYDNQKDMGKLLNTTYHGRSKLVRKKYLSAIIVAIVIWIVETLPWLVVLLRVLPIDGLKAPLQSIEYMEHFPLHISIFAGLILFYLCKCIGTILLALFITGMSSLFNDYVRNIIVTMAIVALPIIFVILGIAVAGKILFMPLTVMTSYFTGASAIEWINLLLIIVVVVMLNLKNMQLKRGGIHAFRNK